MSKARISRKKLRRPPPSSTPPVPAEAPCERGHIDADLLRDLRKKAFLLLLAADGLMHADYTYVHEDFKEGEVLQMIAHEISSGLAELGKQAEGEDEPEAAEVAS